MGRGRAICEYQPGKSNPADYDSRHPVGCPSAENIDESETDKTIAYITRNAIPKAMTLAEVQQATACDPMLQDVTQCLQSVKWHKPPPGVSLAELSRYEQVKDALTCSDNVVLKSNRIVMPLKLQERTVDIAHESHLGIVKTKGLLREKVWFPLMRKLVETKVKSCLACQVATPVLTREPLQMTVLPGKPFEMVSVDFCYVEGETVVRLFSISVCGTDQLHISIFNDTKARSYIRYLWHARYSEVR